MAGSLVAMVARGASAWEDGARIAGRATALREALPELARAETQAVRGLLPPGRLPEAEQAAVRERAIQSPAAIEEAAREVAELAELAEVNGKPAMRADATAARLLATAAAQVAAEITAANQSG